MRWCVVVALLATGCAMGRVPVKTEKGVENVWYLMIGTKVKTDVITVDALPEFPQSLISIGALGASKN